MSCEHKSVIPAVGDPDEATWLTRCLVFRAPRGAQREFEVCHLPLQVDIELIMQLAVVLFLPHLQVSSIPVHAPCHVVWKVVEHKSGLLLSSSDEHGSVSGEVSEVRKCEQCKTKNRAVGVLCMEQCAVLHKHDT